MTGRTDSVTFSIRIDRQLLERIDRSAAHHGETRTDYVLRWLPDLHDQPARRTTTSPDEDTAASR